MADSTFLILSLERVQLINLARPGLLKSLSEAGRIAGEFIEINSEVYSEVMCGFPGLLGLLEVSAVQVRTVAETEAARLICEACPHFETSIRKCIDKDCGCYRSENRLEPWMNRPTKCRFWSA